MIRLFSDFVKENIPVISGSVSTVSAVVDRGDFTGEATLYYILFAIIGALVGYGVKSILDCIELDKRIKKLYEQLKK